MKFLRALTNNIAIKTISLILAILTWSYIASYLYRESATREKQASSIIEVSGEKLLVKRLPIYINIEGSPAAGFEIALDSISVSPPYSVVTGPADVIKDVSYIITEPININGADNSIRKSTKLTPMPSCEIGYDGLVNVIIPIRRQRHR